MLSPKSAEIVRATAPAVAAHAVEITSVFYPSMFAAHPELLRVFNQGNQANGEQSRALAASVVAYAQHLLGALDRPFQPVLERIAHKHVSLGIRPSWYTIVGRHLLDAVGQVLGDAVTPEVAAAWDEVYWLFATELVAEEARLYDRAGVDPSRPYSPWRVVRRTREVEDVVSLTLMPAADQKVPGFLPGQYVSVAVDLPDGRRQPRQYTLSEGPGRDQLRITVRRVPGAGVAPAGDVSTFLHDEVREGDLLDVSTPAGDVALRGGNGPLVLLSAGIGITPVAAILDHLARNGPDREVVAAHADRSPATHALRDDVASAGANLTGFTQLTWYEDPAGEAGVADVHRGLMDVAALPLPAGAEVFMCGPLPFMRTVRRDLIARGVHPDRIHYEVFGPDLWAGSPE